MSKPLTLQTKIIDECIVTDVHLYMVMLTIYSSDYRIHLSLTLSTKKEV